MKREDIKVGVFVEVGGERGVIIEVFPETNQFQVEWLYIREPNKYVSYWLDDTPSLKYFNVVDDDRVRPMTSAERQKYDESLD